MFYATGKHTKRKNAMKPQVYGDFCKKNFTAIFKQQHLEPI